MDIKYKLEKISLDSFAVNNLSDKLPEGFVFFYNMSFQETIIGSSQTIKINFLLNVFLDENPRNRVSTIETTTTYKILNFKDLVAYSEIPNHFIASLLGIAISTTRGMLLVRCAGTSLDQFILPIINPTEIIQKLENTKTPERFITKANNYIQIGNEQKALELYSQSLELDPKNIEALFNRSFIYYKKAQYDLAIIDLDRFIDIKPNILGAYLRRGSAYLKKEKFTEAISDFNKAIELNPDNIEPYYNRAQAFRALKQYKETFEDLSTAIDLQPTFSILYATRGAVYLDIGEYNKAIEDYNKALSLEQTESAYATRGQLLSKLGKQKEAIEDFNKALELNSENVEALNGRANSYRILGNYKLALADAKKGVKIKPDFNVIYGTLAEIYAEQNNSALFYKYLEIALSKGFEVEKYIDDKAYDKYRNDEKFINLINQYKTKEDSLTK